MRYTGTRWYSYSDGIHSTTAAITLRTDHNIILYYKPCTVVLEEITRRRNVNKQTPRPLLYCKFSTFRVQRFIVAFKFKDTRPPGTPKCPTPVHHRLFFFFFVKYNPSIDILSIWYNFSTVLIVKSSSL